jgi:hypothetical protein
MTDKHSRLACQSLILPLLILAFTSMSSAQWNEQVLYSFQGGSDGNLPVGGVVFDAAGNLYGATYLGGTLQCGNVYELSPPAKPSDPWTEAVIYTFRCKAANDGTYPLGGLIIDSAGNLYGTTAYGGAGNCILSGALMGCGMVYELSPPAQNGDAWTETILYSFPTDAKEGYVPWGDLVFDREGNLYGATQFGGGYEGTDCNGYYQYCGAVFELSPPKQQGAPWTEQVLYGFRGMNETTFLGDGEYPNGGLVLDDLGNIYGTTFAGGAPCQFHENTGCGTAFELKRPKEKGAAWTETVLHRFTGYSSDGANPFAGLTLHEQALYGTTFTGGTGPGGGILFELSPGTGSDAWTETILYNFVESGYDPQCTPLFDADGNIFGTTTSAQSVHGTVFSLMRPQEDPIWTHVQLYGFGGQPDAGNPSSSLVFDAAGNLYGTAPKGGAYTTCGGYGCGAVFEVSPP